MTKTEPQGPMRLFTLEEANALLPEIRADVEEMLQSFQEIRAEIEQAAVKSGVPVGSPELPKRLEERGVAPRLFQKVRGLIERIHAHGCIVNGPEAGLVDFPCLYGGEIVLLCWKYGEQRVGHWHRIPDGFAGRKPLLDASETEAGAPVH